MPIIRRLILMTLALAAGGCGTSAKQSTPMPVTSASQAAAAPPAAKRKLLAAVPPGPLTATEVMQAFAASTGVHLQVLSSNHSWLQLMPTMADAGTAAGMFGPFALYLVRPGEHVSAAQIFGGRRGQRSADGIVWFPPDVEAYWYAAKRYRNLWVQWKGGIHRGANPQWTALDAGLEALLPA